MRRLLLASCALTCLVDGAASARHFDDEFDPTPPVFQLFATNRITGVKPATATPAALAGSRIAAAGDRALAIDADSGTLLYVDAAGTSLGQLAIGRDAGVLVYDGSARIAYVADRRGDRVVAVRVGDGLAVARTFATPAEPYGLALTPDRKTLLVTAIADRVLAGFDVATGAERWRVAIQREPRSVAVASDGSRAIVAHAGTNLVEDVALATRRVATLALGGPTARGGFAAAFMGEHQAIVPFQVSVPVGMTGTAESTGRYGGVTFKPPLTSHLAFLGWSNSSATARSTVAAATFGQHQPRAVAWDAAHDALYVAGFGTDTVLQIKNASQVDATSGLVSSVGGVQRCGPDGLAIAPNGSVLVWCAFTRSVQRLDTVDAKGALASTARRTAGPELVATALTAQQHDGMVLFHSAVPQISEHGAVACANCHLDGRADGLSWRIEGRTLQTPILAGRLVGTAPYKWDGAAPDLATSMTQTIHRLGGAGISKAQTASLVAYLESLPPVRTPTRDPAAVMRGRQLFDSDDLGCRGCHDGAKYTDRTRHELTGNMKAVDTPSLVGLAASAPYFHDGSAATLEALLRERGAVHGMAASTTLNDRQVADLAAYLETL